MFLDIKNGVLKNSFKYLLFFHNEFEFHLKLLTCIYFRYIEFNIWENIIKFYFILSI
jgi:hypothetical protein